MNINILFVICLLGLTISCVIVPGCIDSLPNKVIRNSTQTPLPEPETGIVRWISAVNDRDYSGVYDLMPAEKRAGISRQEFIRFNRENPSAFVASELYITDFFVLEKQAEGRNATLKAGLQVIGSGPENNGSIKETTVFFTFNETFEDYEWKVWTQ